MGTLGQNFSVKKMCGSNTHIYFYVKSLCRWQTKMWEVKWGHQMIEYFHF